MSHSLLFSFKALFSLSLSPISFLLSPLNPDLCARRKKGFFFGQQIISRTLKRKGKRRGVGDKPPREYIECILGLGNSNFRIVGSEIRPESKQCSAKQYWKFRKKVGFYEPLEEKFEDRNIVASLLFPPWVERKLETSNSRNCWAWGLRNAGRKEEAVSRFFSASVAFLP